MAVDKKVEALRQVYVGIGDAIQALKENDNLKATAVRLEKANKNQEQKIKDLMVIIKGMEALSEKRVQICPECFGVGAYLVGGEPEECDNCDSNGWIEKT